MNKTTYAPQDIKDIKQHLVTLLTHNFDCHYKFSNSGDIALAKSKMKVSHEIIVSYFQHEPTMKEMFDNWLAEHYAGIRIKYEPTLVKKPGDMLKLKHHGSPIPDVCPWTLDDILDPAFIDDIKEKA